ncbi:hypothetical protein ABK040_001732 [Willaertia magna]
MFKLIGAIRNFKWPSHKDWRRPFYIACMIYASFLYFSSPFDKKGRGIAQSTFIDNDELSERIRREYGGMEEEEEEGEVEQEEE